MSFFDQLSAKVNQGFNQVASQTKDFTDQVKIENEIKNLEKAVNACYEELGRAMYNASRNPSDTPVEYEETMRQVDGLLQQIQEKKENKQEIANKVTCPSCGKSVPAGTKFCSFCGAPMGQTPVAAATPVEPQVYNTEPQVGDDKLSIDDDKQHCPNCGEVIEPGTKFCVKCGTKIEAEEQNLTETENSAEAKETSAEAPMEQTPVAVATPVEPQVRDDGPQMGDTEKHCPNCGEVIEPGAKFCVKCGTKIDFGEQKPTENGDSCSAETENSAETADGSAEAEAEEKISD